MTGRVLAVDWGTSNRRAYLIEGSAAVSVERDARGVTAVPRDGFAAEVAALRERHGGVPVLLAGMIGSSRGWIDAGYVACPATLEALAGAVVRPGPGVALVPGVSLVRGRHGDVMRGEEVQLLGAAAAGLVPADALLCQPGTHSKWARLRGGAIAAFTTAMTGEMFALLRGHALIGAAMTAPPSDGAAFRDGVAASADGDLLAHLFGVRAASLLALRDDADAASFVSGLLIGQECRARLAEDGGPVHLLADEALGPFYAAAIAMLGHPVEPVGSDAAFVAGAARLWERVG